MKKLIIAGVLALGGCASAPPPAAQAPTPSATPHVGERPIQPAEEQAKFVRVPMKGRGGVAFVPIGIGEVCCFYFIVDSGAADVSVSPDIFRAMVHDGVITKEDLIDVQQYQVASGAAVSGLRFRIPVLTVGPLTVRNVVGSVTKGSNMLLLGQSFLRKFRFWAIDNRTGELILG